MQGCGGGGVFKNDVTSFGGITVVDESLVISVVSLVTISVLVSVELTIEEITVSELDSIGKINVVCLSPSNPLSSIAETSIE